MLFFTIVYQKVLKALKWYFTPSPNAWDSLHKAAQEFKQDLNTTLYSESLNRTRPSTKELREFVLAHGSGYCNCDCPEEFDALTEAHIKFAEKLLNTYSCNNSSFAVECKFIYQDLVSIANRVANLPNS